MVKIYKLKVKKGTLNIVTDVCSIFSKAGHVIVCNKFVELPWSTAGFILKQMLLIYYVNSLCSICLD